MAIDFVIKDEAWRSKSESFRPTFEFPELRLDPARFPLLAYLDPWGRTTFNRRQAGALVRELEQLVDVVPPGANGDVEKLKALCEEVMRRQHHFLVALGD